MVDAMPLRLAKVHGKRHCRAKGPPQNRFRGACKALQMPLAASVTLSTGLRFRLTIFLPEELSISSSLLDTEDGARFCSGISFVRPFTEEQAIGRQHRHCSQETHKQLTIESSS
jgi:hypothetical protein